MQGHYPKQWASSYITPIHKGKDAHDPYNYRGIFISSAIGKLFNSILNARLDKFLLENEIIDKCQIGFTNKARTSDHMFILKCLIDNYFSSENGPLYSFIDVKRHLIA